MATTRPTDLAEALEALRGQPPLVQCLTNTVVQQWTANVLLASGASPAMVDNQHEAGPFATVADAVLVNLGTPHDDTADAMKRAVLSATEHGRPWVLDPVAVGGLAWRTDIACDLLTDGPTVIRGNASEISALAGGAAGRGTDATIDPEGVLGQANELARASGAVIAISGPTDIVTDGDNEVRLAHGHVWLTKVTGAGCALGALVAAYAAVSTPVVAAAAATAHLTLAAESAAEIANGPGTFAAHLLDAMALMEPGDLAKRVVLR